jgi:hypothetical protein
MKWFKRNAETRNALKNIEKRMAALENALTRLVEAEPSLEIRIENLDVRDPVIENLTFKFDKLDVKEVSGALNLGNNFGVRVHQDPTSRPSDKKVAASRRVDKPQAPSRPTRAASARFGRKNGGQEKTTDHEKPRQTGAPPKRETAPERGTYQDEPKKTGTAPGSGARPDARKTDATGRRRTEDRTKAGDASPVRVVIRARSET